MLLSINDLNVDYDSVPAIRNFSLNLGQGEVHVVLGTNGAGKTTLIKSIMGLKKKNSGTIVFNDAHDISNLRPNEIHSLGISWVPEGRLIWGTLTVMDNLRMGAFNIRNKRTIDDITEQVFKLFPVLREKQGAMAANLSGGEQQMLAIARALMSRPSLLLMDEPSLGLAPKIVSHLFQLIEEIRGSGIGVLLVEQNAGKALKISDSATLLETGTLVYSGSASEIMANNKVKEVFLGQN